MDSSGQNIFFPLAEQQASHTFDMHTDKTQEMLWSSGETRCFPSLSENLMFFHLIDVSNTSMHLDTAFHVRIYNDK